ncbi:DUF1090 domain-containing protein [Herbaspirillum robiniae]|uniref:DUF1090 domain-containing protein n=1 Tax=Herbaspirillum robiniae TaxID=2014887 RepID=A0A246WW12_9BURK|nr:DUF1090 domain-containing protein [Herbaspirillum robiniae]OWY31168.1 hypothetical protein CEJ42_03700 [Herbaspirillum robiniae]
MKKLSASLLALALPLSLAAGHVSAQALTGCAAKKADVQTQLEQARAHGNKAQEAKLKIAQKQLETNCTDEGLRREREADIKKKQEKVDARKADLEKAQAKGKSKKIAQQEKKLKDAEDELKAAREKLNQ